MVRTQATMSLPGSTRAVVVGRSFDRQRTASTSNTHPPGRARTSCRRRAGFKMVLPAPAMLQRWHRDSLSVMKAPLDAAHAQQIPHFRR